MAILVHICMGLLVSLERCLFSIMFSRVKSHDNSTHSGFNAVFCDSRLCRFLITAEMMN